MRGALRTSRTRGGMRWTRKARETHAPDVYGEVVWFGRRGAGAKLAIRSASDGGKRAVLREEHEVSRKATAQGRPGCSACTCMLVCAFAMCTGTRDRGCSKHPVFPAPSIQEEGNEFSNLGRNTPRDRGGVSTSLRAQRSNPCLHLRPDGLLRFARNDEPVARMKRSAIRDLSNTAPDFAEPVITVRAQLRSSRARIRATRWLHPGYARFDCGMVMIRFIVASLPRRFRCFGAMPQDAWCGSRHTLSVLSASSLAKEPHCSQTCRKCVWNFHGDNQLSINPCVCQLYRPPSPSAPACCVVSFLW